jgi:hypothetical protein
MGVAEELLLPQARPVLPQQELPLLVLRLPELLVRQVSSPLAQ